VVRKIPYKTFTWRVARTAALCGLVLAALGASSMRAGFTGTYLRESTGIVDYFQLTEVSNTLSGQYAAIVVDPRYQNGTRVSREEITGIAQGTVATLRRVAGDGILSSSQSLGAADIAGNTLTLRAPGADGHLNSWVYRRASDDQLNAAVSAINARARLRKQMYDDSVTVVAARVELTALAREIPELEARRARTAAMLLQAQAELAGATAALDSLRRAVVEARRVATEARRTAVTPQDEHRAGALEVATGGAEVRVGGGEVRLVSAQNQLQSAQEELKNCDDRLRAAHVRVMTDSARLRSVRPRN
jgi:hypothetical protein